MQGLNTQPHVSFQTEHRVRSIAAHEPRGLINSSSWVSHQSKDGAGQRDTALETEVELNAQSMWLWWIEQGGQRKELPSLVMPVSAGCFPPFKAAGMFGFLQLSSNSKVMKQDYRDVARQTTLIPSIT